jgi:hypothetical protein
MIYLDQLTNSCKSAQYSCFTLWCVGITKNTRGNLVGVKSGLSRNLSQNFFQRWSRYGSKTASNVKLPNYKVVVDFTRNILNITFNWFWVRTAEVSLIYYNPRLGDGNPRSYIKGGNLTRGGLLHPRIAASKRHIFSSSMDPISMGEGSQEAMKEGG